MRLVLKWTDKKGRYRFNKEHTSIKACQGHSIPWVEPEVEYMEVMRFIWMKRS